MGIIQKQSFGSSVLLAIGILLGFATAGFLLPNYFTEEENGLITLLNSYSLIYSQIVILGLHTVVMRFYPRFKDQMNGRNDFLTLTTIVTFSGFLLFLVFYYFSKPHLEEIFEKSPLFGDNYYLLLPLTLFTAFFYLFDAYSSAMLKTVRGFFLKDVFQRLLILALIGLYIYLSFSFSLFILFYTAAICIPTIILGFMLLYEKQYHPGLPNLGLYKIHKKELSKVALYTILTGISFVGVANIDAIMIERYLDLEQAGIYGRNMFFGVLVAIPYRAIHKISSGVISSSFQEKNYENIKVIYYKSTLNQLIIASFLFLGLWINIDNIYQLIPQSYEQGKWVIFFIGLGNLITMAGGVNTAVISFSPYYQWHTIFLTFLVALIIGSNMIMIPLWGITGAAMATAASIFLYNLLMYLFLYQKYRFQPFNINHLKILIFSTLAYGIIYCIPAFSNFLVDIGVRSSVFTLLFVVGIALLKVSPDMNEMLFFVLKKVRKMIKL